MSPGRWHGAQLRDEANHATGRHLEIEAIDGDEIAEWSGEHDHADAALGWANRRWV